MKILEVFGAASDRVSEGLEAIPRGELSLQSIFNWIYGFVAIVAVGYLIYGGIGYIMSQGDPAKTAKSKNAITASVIGLVIVAMAGAITNFVFSIISENK